MNTTMSLDETKHDPVMLDQVLSIISPQHGGNFIDCTFGGGGYSRAILKYPNTKVYAIDRDKITKSINISLRKRPIDSEATEKFISKIVRNLEGLGENDIPTALIGKFVMEGLANLDQVAYVRFASVYKDFKEAKDFEKFIGNLNVYKSE